MNATSKVTHALIGQYVQIIKAAMNADVALDGKVIPIGLEISPIRKNQDVK